mgnify:CR=1 FL=1
MDIFWDYFTNVWIKKYDPKDWNVNASSDEEIVDIVNRTNNSIRKIQSSTK